MQPKTLKGKRIFIVEDDVTNMAVFAYTLKNQGAIVIQDPWNAATIKLIKQHLPIDIILLDLMLRQGVSGYDIYDHLKADIDLAYIPVLAVSASDPEIELPKLQARGFAGFIPKPISVLGFPHHIEQCLNSAEFWTPMKEIRP